MRFTRVQAMLLVALLHYLIPAALITWCLVAPFGSLVDWGTKVLLLASYAFFIYLCGTWVFASYYARCAVVLASLAVILRSAGEVAGLPLAGDVSAFVWIREGLSTAASLVILVLAANALRARFFEQEALPLSFPFARGVHSVFEGGNGKRSSLMNYHYGSAVHGTSGVNNSMKYAVDITKVSVWGNDANGVFPRRPERYPVFNEVVLSPCEAVVAAVVDGQPNEEPWSGKGPYNLGNYILLRTGDHHVLLGHLQPGSIRVAAGAVVAAREPLALAGNSGWTSQPHLHIQAMRVDAESFWKGEGVPITFDRRNPIKNRLFFR